MIARRLLIGGALGLAATASATLAQGRPRLAVVSLDRTNAEMRADGHPWWAAFFEELERVGHGDGRTVTVERWAGDNRIHEREVAVLVAQILASEPTLILVTSVALMVPLAQATRTIPIVFVADGPTYFRPQPGGNVTGVSLGTGLPIYGRQLELLLQAAPGASRLAWFGSREFWDSHPTAATVRDAAFQLRLQLEPVFILTPATMIMVRVAFSQLVDAGYPAVLVASDPILANHPGLVAEMAAAAKLPSIGLDRAEAEAGLLMSYGPDFAEMYRAAAGLAAQVLDGAPPGALPVQQAATFSLVVNRRTAETIGLTLPDSIVEATTEFIE